MHNLERPLQARGPMTHAAQSQASGPREVAGQPDAVIADLELPIVIRIFQLHDDGAGATVTNGITHCLPRKFCNLAHCVRAKPVTRQSRRIDLDRHPVRGL